MKGLFGFKEQDKFSQINIDQENKPVKSVELIDIANSDKFISEELIETTIEEMEPVKSIIDETKKCMRRPLFNEWLNLNEASLSRTRKHMINHDSGVITAFRDEYNKGENKSRNKVLLAKLMMQYSVTKAKGSYIENYKTSDAVEVGENVFIVVDINDKGNLEKTLMNLGEFFEQDSILFVPKGAEKGILIGTMDVEYPGYHKRLLLKHPIFGKEGEFFTRVNGRPFVLEQTLTEMVYPGSGMGKWAMSILSKKDWRDYYNENI